MKRWLLVLALLFTSCASVPLKVRVTQSLQASESALGAAQDLERSLCFVDPIRERGSHCTNPIAADVKLTDDVHVKMATAFQKAFDVQFAAASDVQTWQPGQSQPTNFLIYRQGADEVLSLAAALAPTVDPRAEGVISKAKAAVDAAAQIAQMFGAK